MAGRDQPLLKDNLLVKAAVEAGQIGMSFFEKASTNVWYKSGNSPVSQADQEIDTFLRHFLLDTCPDHGWLSEETEDDAVRLENKRVFIVDPIDGTRGFIAGKKEWCISIAIVEDGRPIEGILHCPALGKTIYAAKNKGIAVDGAFEEKSDLQRARPLVTGSSKLIESIRNIPGMPMDTTAFIPSLAYRLSLVATGQLDAAFARPGASEWDIAAADIILEEARCILSDKNGQKLRYNRREVSSPALIATTVSRQTEILGLANSSGILH
ncbi:MAG: 3'(2'),5'-bisphosphate nucleotidase CysQ [Pseudomonadota bacterium]